MATNKNQHFVPRCHLKPFTIDGYGFAINLYNLDRQRLIANAPVKNQCSRDYFYGNSYNLENAIQSLESTYADVIRRICGNPTGLGTNDARFLSYFWVFQHLRTEAIQKNILKHSLDMEEAVGGGVPDLVIEKKEATLLALRAFASNNDAVSDLNLVLVRNRSSTPFVTSDNPAAQTNRWALVRALRGVATFGMHSAGLLAFLPLSPKLLAMLYDKDVYSVAHTDRVVAVRDDADIQALNEHQQLNCVANLYIPSSFTTKHIASLPDLTTQRTASGPRIHVFQKNSNDEHKYYATKGFDREKGTEAILTTPTCYACPTGWPNFLYWRAKGFYFANGSGAGEVRRAWLPREPVARPFRKVYTGH